MSDETVVKVPNSGFFSNINLIFNLPSIDDIKGDNRDPNGFLIKCTEFVNGTERLLTYGCTDCEVMVGYTSSVDTSAEVCLGDARSLDVDNMSWFQRTIGCQLEDCIVPSGYFYNSLTGFYECDGIGCQDAKVGAERDARLKQLGASNYYVEDTLDTDYRSFARFTCNDKLQVQPTIFGVPIFNPAIWMILMLITIMIWGIMNFRK